MRTLGPRPINMRSHEMKDGTTVCATCAPCRVKDARGYAKASGERHRLKAGNISSDTGDSSVISTVILVGVTVVVCAAILVFLLGFFGGELPEEEIPEILKITDISHRSDKKITYAGIVTLMHVGDKSLNNKNYGAYLFVNGGDSKAVIETLNAYDLIQSHHYSVKLIGGSGPSGSTWGKGESGVFDFLDRLIAPGDVVRIDVFERESGKIISRSEFTAPKL